MHRRKTPEYLRGRKCFVCGATAGLAWGKLIPDWEEKRNHVPGRADDPANREVLCRICYEAYQAKIQHAPATPDRLAVLLLRKEKLDLLVARRNVLLERGRPATGLFGPMGRTLTRKEFRAKLEREEKAK